MADKPTETHDGAAPVAASEPAPAPEPTKTGEPELSAKEDEPKPEPQGEGDQADEEAKKPDDAQKSADDAPEKSQPEQDKPAADADVEMKDAAEDAAPEAEAEAPATEAAAETPAPKPKGGNRRKSTAGESKGKALNKKGSKARLTHTDAKPGDHFLVKLKGFPAWPAVICDETMLPAALLNSRPVSAARPDGTYSEAYADGGKRVHDRSFPVMYLYTNEFGWVQNTALSELTPEKAKDSITDKMRKDLRSAMELAAEDHPIDYYKNILTKFQEEQIAQEEARKEAAATPKKSKKGKGKGKAASEDEDAEMEDVDAAPSRPSPRSERPRMTPPPLSEPTP
ncbi:hypothetical protein ACCO45_003346 [Purpureocillium lilacinum]|uniref:Uncharacterized protein n=1 Tax=Purpureocillium lilacinum TaxID=33203 RepID=A0ACC4E2S4_PURLI